MDKHLNSCFTHPIAREIITKANGCLSSSTTCDISFGLVINVDKSKDNHLTTIINPCDRSQSIIPNSYPSRRATPCVGWLLFICYLAW
eukprot:UN03235